MTDPQAARTAGETAPELIVGVAQHPWKRGLDRILIAAWIRCPDSTAAQVRRCRRLDAWPTSTESSGSDYRQAFREGT